MELLEIEPTTVHLHGITRSTSFKLTNKNEFLAISFRVEDSSQTSRITIFPEKGILMGGQNQKIRVKISSDQNTSTSYQMCLVLSVKFTIKNQYNKHFFMKNNLQGWNKISKEQYVKEVQVLSGGQKQEVQNHIKNQIILQKTFQKDQLNLSIIKQVKDQNQLNQSFLDLSIASNFNQKTKKKQRTEQKLLNSSLQLQKIVPLDIGQSKVKQFRGATRSYNKQSASNATELSQKKDSEKLMKTAVKNSFSSDSFLSSNSENSSRTTELIILAIIAAFFVALGNNIKRFLS